MGRLQKKKAAGKKKKKKQRDEKAVSSQITSGAGARKISVFSGSSKDLQKKSSNGNKPLTGEQKKNFLNKGIQFLREVRIELKKVTWPSRKQTIGSTVVVIILVMIIAFFLGIVDIGLQTLIGIVLR